MNIGFREKLFLTARHKWNSFTYQLPIFILALIYPEYIVLWAVQQRITAQYIAKETGVSDAGLLDD
jgi:hypothetical protein